MVVVEGEVVGVQDQALHVVRRVQELVHVRRPSFALIRGLVLMIVLAGLAQDCEQGGCKKLLHFDVFRSG